MGKIMQQDDIACNDSINMNKDNNDDYNTDEYSYYR